MKNQRGFIQIPLLIAIIAGVLVLGGAGYVGVRQYQNPQTEIAKDGQSTSTPELSEVEKLKQEVDELKKQATSQKSPAPQTTPKSQPQQTTPPVSKKKMALSNADNIKHVTPATVFIETTEGAGSGMIIEADGYVLTNAHVVSDVSSVRIKLSDNRSFTASVIGRDEIIDLAILKINETNLSKVELGNSDEVAQGDDVFTLGYPFGIEGDVSFKEGTISRKLTDSSGTYLETSAEIHPGNSGGPLVNKFGEVIGVNAMVFGRSIAGISVGETIKLAIPINTAKKLIPELKNGRSVVLPKKPPIIEYNPPVYDYTSPVITSITIERPLGREAIILVTFSTNEPSKITASFTFNFSQDGNDKFWESNKGILKDSTAISIPIPSWNGNTQIVFSVKATDANGNVSETENYTVRFVDIPGLEAASYLKPLRVK